MPVGSRAQKINDPHPSARQRAPGHTANHARRDRGQAESKPRSSRRGWVEAIAQQAALNSFYLKPRISCRTDNSARSPSTHGVGAVDGENCTRRVEVSVPKKYMSQAKDRQDGNAEEIDCCLLAQSLSSDHGRIALDCQEFVITDPGSNSADDAFTF